MQKLYYGGDIITMRQESDTTEALLEKDGVIQYVGTLEEAEALCEESVHKICLNGKTLMPAFIDPHSHLTMLAQFSALAPLGSSGSFQDIVANLRAYRDDKELGDGDVLMGFGYDHNFLKEKAHPTRWVLDQVSAEMPICILHASGHMWSTHEGQQRIESHGDKLMNYIRFWQAAGESEKTSMRTRDRIRQIVSSGHFAGGVVPYGYRAINYDCFLLGTL